VDIFSGSYSQPGSRKPKNELATPSQVKYLVRLGVAEALAEKLTMRQATGMIGQLLKRHDKDGRMPFGKYAGRRIEEVPIGYLKWYLDSGWDEKLKSRIRSVLDTKGGH
jgi:hypothetical protein